MYCTNSYRFLLLTAALLALGTLSARADDAPAKPPAGTPMPHIVGPGNCVGCHKTLTDERLSSPALTFVDDRHGKWGMGCADCHGGDPKAKDPDAAHSKAAGFIGIPQPEQIPDLCGRCHSNSAFMITQNPKLPVDQEEKYWTSRHGELLKMGLRKVAQCAACHTAHNVRPASDPRSTVYAVNVPKTCAHCHGNPKYMAGFPIPTDIYVKYATSVHGVALMQKGDLGAPACNDCHGNHGAIPPGVNSLARVCGLCHSLNMEYFDKGPHAAAFKLKELPQCMVCHGHHAIAQLDYKTFAMQAGSVCINCHHEGDEGWKIGRQMYEMVSDIIAIQTQAKKELDEAQDLGMDVSEGRFALQDYHKSYVQMRSLSHEFDWKAFQKMGDKAKVQAETALKVGNSAMHEYHYRRQGLLVALFLGIPVLILLFLKIRAIESK